MKREKEIEKRKRRSREKEMKKGRNRLMSTLTSSSLLLEFPLFLSFSPTLRKECVPIRTFFGVQN